MHIVEMADPEHTSEHSREKSSLFVGMDNVVPVLDQHDHGLGKQDHVEKQLGPGRPYLDFPNKGNVWDSQDPDAWDVQVKSDVICEQVHLMPQDRQHAETLVDTDGSPSWLKEWLRRNHKNIHRPYPAWADSANVRLV